MLTDSLPFHGDTVEETLHAILRDDPPDPKMLRRDMPSWLSRVCLKGLQKNKGDRYPSASSFAGALLGFWED